MITNPVAKTILCFGDSNTNGVPSDDEDYVRLAADVRWTGRLQRLLGDGYDVIEEGLSGRTTDIDYGDRPGCNGRVYLVPCLQTHQPLDVVVLMLGTNDLKIQFDRTPADIAMALSGYIDDIEFLATTRAGRVPRIILVSPIHLDDSRPAFAEMTEGNFDPVAVDKSRSLSRELHRLAGARRAMFADAATVARAGGDGVHLSLESHESIAKLIAMKVTDALPHDGSSRRSASVRQRST